MKKITITIMLAFIVSVGIAQSKFVPNDNIFINGSTIDFHKQDTVQVLAYCIDDFDKPLLAWRKLYAVYGWDLQTVNFNGLMIYKKYLMFDRKTPVNFKVVYAINKP